MKRSWLVPLVAAAVLGGAGSASALYSPNPAARWAPGHFFLAGDFLFNTEKDLDPRGELEDMTGFFARPAYTLMPNLIVYGRGADGGRPVRPTDRGAGPAAREAHRRWPDLVLGRGGR